MKKQRFRLTVFLLLFSVVFVSCKKDDTSNNNKIVYNDAEYSLSRGYLEAYGLGNPNSYGFKLFLVSSEVGYDNYLDLFFGTGNGVVLSIYSSSELELVPGTYTFDKLSAVANKFTSGAILIDYDFLSISKAAILSKIIAGTVIVGKNGSEYEFTIDCTLDDGKNFTAYYIGSLELHDKTY